MEMYGCSSAFINEIDSQFLTRFDQKTEEEPVMEMHAVPVKKAAVPARMPQYEDFSQEEKSYRVGGYIKHPAWGNGKIIGISGFGPDTKLTIAFGNEHKKVLARYAQLEII